MELQFEKFSDSLSSSLTNLYRVGGLALVFIFIGVVTMTIGNFSGSALSAWIFGVGVVITICCLGLFVYAQLKGPMKAARLLRDNKETMDTIQGIALELTHATSALQSLTFKHMKEVDRALQTAIPMLASIPMIGRKMQELGVSDAQNISRIIVDTSTRVDVTIRDIETALITANPEKLRIYLNDLSELTREIRAALAAGVVNK